MTTITLPIHTLTKGITMEVTISGYHTYMLRLWLAMKLFILAGWISGMNIVINDLGPAGMGVEKSGT